MLKFTKRFTTLALRCFAMPYKFQPVTFFCNQKELNPIFVKLKQTYQQKGKQSKEYQQEMARAMRQALSKFDDQTAINLELHHLSLIKQTDGEKSQSYRTQLRQITKFCMNRQHFQTAAQLVEKLKTIQQSIENISRLDLIATYYLQGCILTQLDQNEESKKLFNKCIQSKQVQQAPQVYFKVFAQLARVHAKCGEKQQTYNRIAKCEQIINSRKYDPSSPPMVLVMDLLDVFQLAELASNINDKKLADKYTEIYREKLEKVSNKKDPMYVQYLERKARIHFNLKQFSQAVGNLKQAVNLSQQLAKVDPNFSQNVKILSNIAQSIEKQYLTK